MNVDLPLPEAPTTAMNAPLSMLKVTPRSAWTVTSPSDVALAQVRDLARVAPRGHGASACAALRGPLGRNGFVAPGDAPTVARRRVRFGRVDPADDRGPSVEPSRTST